jgi:hypothetical protein
MHHPRLNFLRQGGAMKLQLGLRVSPELARRQVMRGSRVRPFVGILAASSLFVSSTGAVAATSARAMPQVNPWAALTAMSGGAPAAALCGSAAAVAAAAQAPAGGCVLPQADLPAAPAAAGPPPPTPVPVPPVEVGGVGFGIDPLILGLGALAAGALVYFLVIKKDNDNDESPS